MADAATARNVRDVASANGVRNRELRLGRSLGLTHALIVRKEKDLILENAVACRSSELILPQRLFPQVQSIVEVIGRIKCVITQKVKGRTVECVSPRARYGVDYAA